MHDVLATAITWDPFVRGTVITILFVVLLPGSVFGVLSTNTGIRLGFLLGAAGLFGMVALLALLWMPLASTADVGRPNSWKPLEVITGSFGDQVTIKGAQSFPANNVSAAGPPSKTLPTRHWYWPLQGCSESGWHKIDPSLLSDPESEADKILVPVTNTSGSVLPALSSPFSAAGDYVYLDGFQKGQNGGCLFAVSRHKIYLPAARGAHYVILRPQAGPADPQHRRRPPDPPAGPQQPHHLRHPGAQPRVGPPAAGPAGPQLGPHLRCHLLRAAYPGEGGAGDRGRARRPLTVG